MEFLTPENELDIDVRTVAVIWTDRGEDSNEPDIPEVAFTGCSPYEAVGLLVVGAIKMAMEYGIPFDEEDEDD